MSKRLREKPADGGSAPDRTSKLADATAAELRAADAASSFIDHTSPDSLRALCRALLKLPDALDTATKLITTESAKIAANVSSFSSRAFESAHSLDRMRPSQQFSQVGEIIEELAAMVNESKIVATTHPDASIRMLLSIGEAVLSTNGEVHKGLCGCGSSIIGDIVDAVMGIEGYEALLTSGNHTKLWKSLRGDFDDDDERFSE